MSYRDQQKYLDTLKKYESKFNKKEYDGYKMFVKMNKDEEDFDSLSMKRLKELYDKYFQPVDKSKYDSFFKSKSADE